jgi:hypothetical protein
MHCWLITKQEDDALQGCSLLAQVIYMRGIRPFMDYMTRISGKHGKNQKAKKLNLSGLADISRFKPDWGSTKQEWSPTKEEVRAALDELKRAGLLIDRGSNLRDGLIFFLPLAASLDQSIQKRNPAGTPQRNPAEEPHTKNNGDPREYDKDEERNPTEEPHTRMSRNPTQKETGNKEKELPKGSSKKKPDTAFELLTSEGVDAKFARDFLTIRKEKGVKGLTETALDRLKSESKKAGLSLNDAVRFCAESEWTRFNAGWYAKAVNSNSLNPYAPQARTEPKTRARDFLA